MLAHVASSWVPHTSPPSGRVDRGLGRGPGGAAEPESPTRLASPKRRPFRPPGRRGGIAAPHSAFSCILAPPISEDRGLVAYEGTMSGFAARIALLAILLGAPV